MLNILERKEIQHSSLEKCLQIKRIAIIGGGLHANVVLDIIESINSKSEQFSVIGYYDDDPKNKDMVIPYLGTVNDLILQYNTDRSSTQAWFITCLGENLTRKSIVQKLQQSLPEGLKIQWATLIHPLSSISRLASISEGTVICAGSVVGPHAVIGSHVIINTHASVDHHCKIGDYVHIAPGVHLCGSVQIGDQTLVGVGSCIVPKVHVGQKSIIGAGTTVLADVADSTKAVGIVKPKKHMNESCIETRLCWLAQKPVNFSRIEYLLQPSIERNHFANFGPCVKQLESFLKTLLGINSSKAVILANNGSAALHAIIGGLNIHRERKLRFATQAFTFPTSVQCNLVGSAIVDIDKGMGLNLDLIDVNSLDGIIVTNVFGHVVDIKQYTEWSTKYNKYVIFDNAATSYTFYQGQNSLNYGTASFISFHHTKPAGFGEGGAIIIDGEYEAAIRQSVNFGYDVPKGDIVWHPDGSNYKMSDVQAAFIHSYLDTFHDIVQVHKSLYEKLTHGVSKLDISIKLLPNFSSGTPFTSCFPVVFAQLITESLVKSVASEESIDIRKYYKPLITSKLLTPIANDVYDHIVCFPCHSQMTDEHVAKIISVIQKLHERSVEQHPTE